MEDTTILLIIALIGVFALIGARMIKPGQAKTKVKKTVETAQQVIDTIQLEQIERLKSQLKSEAGRANRLQALRNQQLHPEQQIEIPTEQVQPLDNSKPATWEELEALCKASYPQYAKYLAIPGIQDKVMEQVKGMTLAQIIQQLQTLTGGQPSGQSQTSEYQIREDYA